ncbi:MAG: hypothetical protein D6719_13875, partial [Candidatus Dadabacteria bacterium]
VGGAAVADAYQTHDRWDVAKGAFSHAASALKGENKALAATKTGRAAANWIQNSEDNPQHTNPGLPNFTPATIPAVLTSSSTAAAADLNDKQFGNQ